MSSRKTVILLNTFDYELFLGNNSGTVENCLIKPTSAILAVLESYNTKAIFFVDATYLARLKTCSEKFTAALNDYNMIRKQIYEMTNRGHYVYLHVHPHWMDAVYDEGSNTWSLENKTHFSFNNLNETERKFSFEDAFKALKEILIEEHSIEGFRAGGFYVQPITNFKPYFKAFDIKYDFSVLRGSKSHDGINKFSFDFSRHPEKMIYRFDDDVIMENSSGSMTELSINSLTLQGLPRIANSLYYRLTKQNRQRKRWGDGLASGNKISSATSESYFAPKNETFSVELLNPVKSVLYLRQARKYGFLHMVSHPKLVSPSNINSFDNFLKKLFKKVNVISDYKIAVQLNA